MLRRSALNNAINESFSETVHFFAEKCQENLEEERWEWSRPTRRKNGRVVYSPRDIVDTGELKNSQDVTVNGLRGRVSYLADYGADVHEGTEPGHEPRRWITTTVEEEGANLKKTFVAGLRKRLL